MQAGPIQALQQLLGKILAGEHHRIELFLALHELQQVEKLIFREIMREAAYAGPDDADTFAPPN